MSKISLKIEGIKGNGLERYAALAGEPPEELISKWISGKIDYATIAALRAAGDTWETVAGKMGMSITQARRIFFMEGEDKVTKDDIRLLERYIKLMEQLKEGIELPAVPSEEDIGRIGQLIEALQEVEEVRRGILIPTEENIDTVVRLTEALEEAKNAGEGIRVPSEADIEAAERLASAQGRGEE
jgi:hypothetical protein